MAAQDLAAVVLLGRLAGQDERPHRAVEQQDALGEQLVEKGAGVGVGHLVRGPWSVAHRVVLATDNGRRTTDNVVVPRGKGFWDRKGKRPATRSIGPPAVSLASALPCAAIPRPPHAAR